MDTTTKNDTTAGRWPRWLWRFVRRFFRAQTAHREAAWLATCLWKRYYGGISPRWELDDDTAGVVLQISNMTAGLGDQLDHAETLLSNALPPPHVTPAKWETIIREWRDRKHGLSPNAEMTDANRT